MDEQQTLRDFFRPEDELFVARVDRLARSIGALQDTIRARTASAATLRVADQTINASTPAGTAFIRRLIRCEPSRLIGHLFQGCVAGTPDPTVERDLMRLEPRAASA